MKMIFLGFKKVCLTFWYLWSKIQGPRFNLWPLCIGQSQAWPFLGRMKCGCILAGFKRSSNLIAVNLKMLRYILMKIHQSMLGSIKYLRPLDLEIQNSARAAGEGTILDFKVEGSQIFNRAQHQLMYFH